MGIPVMILGKSGTGKSFSLRNLDPNTYGLINVASKPLPFRTNKKPYNSDDYAVIKSLLKRAASDIIVIDDAQYLMANAYMRSAMMKFDKNGVFEFYKKIGYDFWDLIREVTTLPDQKIAYFFGHTEVDDFGNTKFKTIGKMLDNSITVEGMFTIVLRTFLDDGKYYFSTINDGTDTVKAPVGMFSDRLIDNDLAAVDAAIRNYYGFPAPFSAEQKKQGAAASTSQPAATTPERKQHANSLI